MESLRESPAFTISLLMDSFKNHFTEANLKVMFKGEPKKATPDLKDLEKDLSQAYEEEIQATADTFGEDEKPVEKIKKKIEDLKTQIDEHPINKTNKYINNLRVVTNLIYDLPFTILSEKCKFTNIAVLQKATSGTAVKTVRKILAWFRNDQN